MTYLERRDVLKTTGVGAGLAIGVGSTGNPVTACGGATGSANVVTEFGLTCDDVSVAFDTDDPTETITFTSDDLLEDRDTVLSLSGEILDNGRWVAKSDDVSLPEIPAFVPALEIDRRLEAAAEELDLQAEVEDFDFFIALDAFVEFIASLNFCAGIDKEENCGDHVRDVLDDIIKEGFGGGIIGIGTIEREILEDIETIEGYDEEYNLADWFNNPEVAPFILMLCNTDGIIRDMEDLDDADCLEADRDELPAGTPDPNQTVENLMDTMLYMDEYGDKETTFEERLALLEADIEANAQERDLAETIEANQDRLALVDIDVETGHLNSRFDPRRGSPVEMSLTVDPVAVSIDPLGFGHFIGDMPSELSIELTSGESEHLEGDLDLESGVGTLVDNELVVGFDSMRLADIVELLDLNEAWELLIANINVTMLMDQESDVLDDSEDMSLEGQLDRLGLEAILAEIDLVETAEIFSFIEELLAERVTDEPGRHVLELAFDFDIEDRDALDSYLDEWELPQPIGGMDTPPQDLTGDNLFEDLTGSEDVGVQDVQILFEHANSIPAGQAPYYNFSCLDDDRVTIFDVQGLFNRI